MSASVRASIPIRVLVEVGMMERSHGRPRRSTGRQRGSGEPSTRARRTSRARGAEARRSRIRGTPTGARRLMAHRAHPGAGQEISAVRTAASASRSNVRQAAAVYPDGQGHRRRRHGSGGQFLANRGNPRRRSQDAFHQPLMRASIRLFTATVDHPTAVQTSRPAFITWYDGNRAWFGRCGRGPPAGERHDDDRAGTAGAAAIAAHSRRGECPVSTVRSPGHTHLTCQLRGTGLAPANCC